MRSTRSALVLVLATGCATGGASGPTFDYQPTSGAARYAIGSRSAILVDTPMGLQESGDSSRSTLAIEVGGQSDAGRSVAVTFEELVIHETGMTSRTTTGGELLGQRLEGTLSPTGRIDITSETKTVGAYDPVAAMADFLVPMPADGNTATPWSVNTTFTTRGEMEVTAVFEGTGRLVGDTVWNGRPAKVIQVDGTVTQNGSGQPTDSPVPLEISFSGSSTRTYVWDHMAGVMLAAVVMEEATGSLVAVGFDLTMSATAEGKVEVNLIP